MHAFINPVKITLPHVKDEVDFKRLLEEHPKIMIQFYATWCPPCKAATPIFQGWDEEYPKIPFYLADIENLELVSIIEKYKVKALPTYILFVDKKAVYVRKGLKKEKVRAVLDEHSK